MDRTDPSPASLLTPANVIAALFILAVTVVAFGLLFASVLAPSAGARGLRALVHDADGITHEMPLDRDATLVVSTDEGENTIMVEDGQVYMAQADCDGQDCVHQGSLSAPGGQIICLPHRLWIEVVAADGTSGEMDASAAIGPVGSDEEGPDGDEGTSGNDGIDVLSR